MSTTSTDDNGFTYQAEIRRPSEEPAQGYQHRQDARGKALKFVHRGSYDNMDNHLRGGSPITSRQEAEEGHFIEEYITDPLKTAGRQAGDQRLCAVKYG